MQRGMRNQGDGEDHQGNHLGKTSWDRPCE